MPTPPVSVVPPAVSLRNVSKTFPGQQALNGMAMDVAPGRVHALVGQNGSGKSTLIKILAGFHQPDRGAVAEVHGVPFRLGSPAAARAAGLRFVHQDLGLVPALSVLDNLALGVGFRHVRAGRIVMRLEIAAAQRAMRSVGMEVDVQAPAESLSPAERTGVAIARAVQGGHHPVHVLTLDEPTASLPITEIQRLFEIVRTVKASGVAVIYVSHRLDEVLALSDEVTVLRDGNLIESRPVGGLTEEDLIAAIVGRRVQRTRSAPQRSPDADPVLEVRDLRGDAVERVSFLVRGGEVVGIAGLAGSGRDAVARLIFGGLARDGGEVLVAGAPVLPMRPDKAIDAGMAFVPADRRLHGSIGSLTARENLTLSGLKAFSKAGFLRLSDEIADVERWFRALDVRPSRTEAAFESFSGGNQQKIMIAKWLRRRPRALLLDEPTQGVDVATKSEIHRLIDEAAAAGAAVLVSSAEPEELARLCHRVIVLRDGVVAQVLDRDTLTVEQIVNAVLATNSAGVQP